MGLDIFLYRFKKVDLDKTKSYTEDELCNQGISAITVADQEEEMVLPQDIINDFAIVLDVEQKYWDWIELYKLFQKEYPHLYPDDVSLVMKEHDLENGFRNVVADGYSFSPYSSGTIQSPFDDFDETPEFIKYMFRDSSRLENPDDKFSYPTIFVSSKGNVDPDHLLIKSFEPSYVYKMEEVDYQRKGLNNYGWSLLPENCTCSRDKSNVEEMVNSGGLNPTFLENWVDGETALYAWW